MANEIIPTKYLSTVQPLIAKARELLESGEELAAMVLVGNFTTGQFVPVPIDTTSPDERDAAAEDVRRTASIIDADYVFTIMEAWTLGPEHIKRSDEIIDRYGSVSASPYKVEVVSFLLETPYGLWVAQPRIKAKGISKKKRTFGDVEFQRLDEAQGRFADLLPKEAGGTLH
ncbi:hypothetical protein [Thauera sp. 2A1]|uniref:hypothetical protein n=1 Tax=Thauera sp. 2A1 TaxID=2570191 RepID=UPI001291BEB5|nr:hypothetical protein [Thauera sp. 2A1]KAI5915571.1 hypothetical protein GH664_06390 [Thauera sp. 2A1]